MKIISNCIHPGGYEITRRALDACSLPSKAKVLDIGCGDGTTAAWIKDEYNFEVTGVDKSSNMVSLASKRRPDISFMEGDGEMLSFSSYSFDCILMECTLSLFTNQVEAIHESFCVLKNGGYLIVNDLYIPSPSQEDYDKIAQFKKMNSEKISGERHCNEVHVSECSIDGVLVLDDINAALNELGFEIILFEDRKIDLGSFAAIQILEYGSIEGFNQFKQNKHKISYFLLVARKGVCR